MSDFRKDCSVTFFGRIRIKIIRRCTMANPRALTSVIAWDSTTSAEAHLECRSRAWRVPALSQE